MGGLMKYYKSWMDKIGRTLNSNVFTLIKSTLSQLANEDNTSSI